MRTNAWNIEVDADTRASFDALCAALRRREIELVTSRDVPPFAAFEDAFFGRFIDHCVDLTSYEMKWPYEQYLAGEPELLEPRQKQRLANAREVTPEIYGERLAEKAAMKERARQAMAGAEAAPICFSRVSSSFRRSAFRCSSRRACRWAPSSSDTRGVTETCAPRRGGSSKRWAESAPPDRLQVSWGESPDPEPFWSARTTR
jgi:hypothetical protein